MTAQRAPAGALGRVPAPALFLLAGVSQYLGAALAVGLYHVLPAPTVAWGRGLTGAVVLLLLVRPWRVRWAWRELAQSSLFGVVLLGMNLMFYVAIGLLPLGAAVAIEFIGPVLVAAWGGRSARHRIAIALATFGVLCISLVGLDWGGQRSTAELAWGVLAALAAGSLWGTYMVLGSRIVRSRSGTRSLTVGLSAGSLVYAPVGLVAAGVTGTMGHLTDPSLLGVLLAVGLLSTVLPYTLDQVTMKRLSTATFALLNALLPVSATVIGVIMLSQLPTWGEIVGIVAVSAAVAISSRRGTPAPGSERPAADGEP
ncbi:EamA family transporter [Ruania albidiflava]|uniref:EamA family transporter n=1 Tax=Ruania albidiflava TaxID=366586 RepID=UPI0003B5AC12|nr:EamA family transporter [Ruania albidiflava]